MKKKKKISKEPKKKRGRPSKFTTKLANAICLRLAHGESLRSICRDDDMPAISSVLKWIFVDKKEDFSEQYAKARQLQAELMADEIVEIADDGRNDWQEKETERGGYAIVVDHEHIARSRLRVDTRKWVLSKVLPKKYGDSLDLTSKGEKIENVTVKIVYGSQSAGNGGIPEESGMHEQNSGESRGDEKQ